MTPVPVEGMSALTVWTIGHSTHGSEAFVAILHAHAIEAIADVRRFPGSRRHPHFGAEALRALLATAGIDYHGFPDLGGRRTPRPDSPHTAWRNAAFRGYADYMDTPDFGDAMRRLEQIAAGRRTAILCAEALWWHCHRALISDYLKVRGVEVLHVGDAARASPHPFTKAARTVAGRLSYGAAQLDLPPPDQR